MCLTIVSTFGPPGTEAVERVTTGLEKRQRLIQEDEKQRVAYHESAHALVAYSLPNTDPVHKVSIIPRGLAALGYTMQRPEGDRYLMTQSELESRIQVLLAGTVAEEMIFEDIYNYLYRVNDPNHYHNYFPGNYTRYGDVTPLLSETEDFFVIYGQGDELDLRFELADSQPAGTYRINMRVIDSNGQASGAVAATVLVTNR